MSLALALALLALALALLALGLSYCPVTLKHWEKLATMKYHSGRALP